MKIVTGFLLRKRGGTLLMYKVRFHSEVQTTIQSEIRHSNLYTRVTKEMMKNIILQLVVTGFGVANEGEPINHNYKNDD